MIARFGNTAVPWTVSWTSEGPEYVGICPVLRVRAMCMGSSPGVGKPRFSKPHSIRQREAIWKDLCDLCGRSLKNTTKISLSHARPNSTAASGGTGILQVEPLLHRGCARESCRFCPSLKRDIDAGTLMVRMVTNYRTQYALMGPQYVHHYVPDYIEQPKHRPSTGGGALFQEQYDDDSNAAAVDHHQKGRRVMTEKTQAEKLAYWTTGYNFWKASTGEPYPPEYGKPQCYDDTPCAGFYRKGVYEKVPDKRSKRVGWSPVAVFADGGELIAVTERGTISNAALREIWTYICGQAILEGWFRAVERGAPWPDAHDAAKNKIVGDASGIPITEREHRLLSEQTIPPKYGVSPGMQASGIKESPESKEGRLARELAEAKAGVSQYEKIDSDTMAGQALSLKNTITAKAGDLDKIREALVRPHIDAQRDVNDRINPIIKDAKAQSQTLLRALGAWEDQKREAARIAEQARQKQIQEHAAAALKAKESDAPPLEPVKSNAPPPSDQVAAAVGRKASVKVAKFVTDIDLDKSFAQFRAAPEVHAVLIGLAQRAVNAGLPVDGATIDERSVVR